MERKKILIFLSLTALLVFACGCDGVNLSRQRCYEQKSVSDEQGNTLKYGELYEKGYDLPIVESEQREAEEDCKSVMKKISGLYSQVYEGDPKETALSDEMRVEMLKALETVERPILSGSYSACVFHYEMMENFLKKCMEGEKGEIESYELYEDGSIGRRKFSFDGTDMYILYTNAVWRKDGEPAIASHSYNRIKKWSYTDKGWFIFEYCVPEQPEVSEYVNGNAMIRIKPQNKTFAHIAERYLFPIGYQGNNLFCSDWDAENMEKLDYNALYQYLYALEYGKRLEAESYMRDIPAEEFEQLLMKYLPVTAEQLRRYAVYDSENQTYAWVRPGCGNYEPNTFGTSMAEITAMQENADGTITLTVDAVCEMLGSDAVITHLLTVAWHPNESSSEDPCKWSPEDGDIQYLKNQILGDGLEQIPPYQYRINRQDKS